MPLAVPLLGSGQNRGNSLRSLSFELEKYGLLTSYLLFGYLRYVRILPPITLKLNQFAVKDLI